MPRNTRFHFSTGLARQASVAAFTTARALSSHLRAWFHRRYKPRYRFARFVFGFDVLLLGIASALLILNVFFLLHIFPPEGIGISLELRTPQILNGSDATPIEVKLRAMDGKTHKDVALRILFPEWVEILSAEPRLVKNRIQIGQLRPGDDHVARFLVRIRAAKGTRVSFGFEISQPGFFGIRSSVSGREERTVTQSRLRVTPAIPAHAIVSGGSFPLIISHEGQTPLPLVTLRVTINDLTTQSLVISNLIPRESRVEFIDIGDQTEARVKLRWELLDGAQAIDHDESILDVIPHVGVKILSLRSAKGGDRAIVQYESKTDAALLIVHPQLGEAERGFELRPLSEGGSGIAIPLWQAIRASSTIWSVLPLRPDQDGESYVIGRRVIGHISATFPFATEARYFSAIGDQLGIGPLPPKVGEVTSYWIVWTIGPVESELKSLTMTTALPLNVRATGKFASQFGGTFSTDGKTTTWTVPSLFATGEPATFAFEVAFTPTKDQIGSAAALVNGSSAIAIDAQSSETLEAEASGDDTNLSRDAKAKRRGIIQ